MKISSTDEKKLLKELLDWIRDEKITENPDPDLILRFLEGCKYRLTVAKSKYKNYVETRANSPEWFDNRDPNLDEIRQLLNLGVFLPLPDKDEENRYTILVRATIHDPSTMPISNVYKIGMMVLDLLLETDSDVSKNGVNVLIDLNGVSFGHVWQMSPGLVKKTVSLWQDCYPIRFKSLNFVNCPYFVGFLINLMKNVMSDKLRKRVKVHGSYDDLHQVLNPMRLPKEYGGQSGDVKLVKEEWSEKILNKRDWFLRIST